jgi:hypothetical protein
MRRRKMSRSGLTQEEYDSLICKLAILESELGQARKLIETPAKRSLWRRLWGVGAKAAAVALVVVCLVGGAIGKKNPFGVYEWQKLEGDQVIYVVGYSAGMLSGALVRTLYPEKTEKFFDIIGEWTFGQQVAIIDKYLKDNPDKWDKRFGLLVLGAYEDACAKRGFRLEGAGK